MSLYFLVNLRISLRLDKLKGYWIFAADIKFIDIGCYDTLFRCFYDPFMSLLIWKFSVKQEQCPLDSISQSNYETVLTSWFVRQNTITIYTNCNFSFRLYELLNDSVNINYSVTAQTINIDEQCIKYNGTQWHGSGIIGGASVTHMRVM